MFRSSNNTSSCFILGTEQIINNNDKVTSIGDADSVSTTTTSLWLDESGPLTVSSLGPRTNKGLRVSFDEVAEVREYPTVLDEGNRTVPCALTMAWEPSAASLIPIGTEEEEEVASRSSRCQPRNQIQRVKILVEAGYSITELRTHISAQLAQRQAEIQEQKKSKRGSWLKVF